MGRDYYVAGEALVKVKGAAGTSIATQQDLGLASDSITIRPEFKYLDMTPDAWGGPNGVPADKQWMLGTVAIAMTLIHFDKTWLDEVVRLSMGAPTTRGQVARAGTRMGGGVAPLVSGWKYIDLVLTMPAVPNSDSVWHFPAAHLVGPPFEFPIGVARSLVTLNWEAIPYGGGAEGTAADPYGAGNGAANVILWNHTDPG